jgi:signal transduction histidine kinase
MGLGPYIFRKIAEEDRGQFYVVPRAGGGSTFAMELPRSPV